MAKRVGRSKDLSARQADIMRALFERSTEQHGAGLVRHGRGARLIDTHSQRSMEKAKRAWAVHEANRNRRTYRTKSTQRDGWVGDFMGHRADALQKSAVVSSNR